ncbi:uncharacterized protein LOC143033715 [Oratosquilla oratoria]|uniref:uncharacterized protein LOC143033715 n=1 Tax=Oratosquilla oratoria TaxID=337810 RepID=UPI003F7654A6
MAFKRSVVYTERSTHKGLNTVERKHQHRPQHQLPQQQYPQPSQQHFQQSPQQQQPQHQYQEIAQQPQQHQTKPQHHQQSHHHHHHQQQKRRSREHLKFREEEHVLPAPLQQRHPQGAGEYPGRSTGPKEQVSL